MAAIISTWEQSAQFEPNNPNQISYQRYVWIPGGYVHFYYNKVPTTAKLQGLGATTFGSLPDWLQIAIVGGLGLVGGYFGTKKAYPYIQKRMRLSRHRAQLSGRRR